MMMKVNCDCSPSKQCEFNQLSSSQSYASVICSFLSPCLGTRSAKSQKLLNPTHLLWDCHPIISKTQNIKERVTHSGHSTVLLWWLNSTVTGPTHLTVIKPCTHTMYSGIWYKSSQEPFIAIFRKYLPLSYYHTELPSSLSFQRTLYEKQRPSLYNQSTGSF